MLHRVTMSTNYKTFFGQVYFMFHVSLNFTACNACNLKYIQKKKKFNL